MFPSLIGSSKTGDPSAKGSRTVWVSIPHRKFKNEGEVPKEHGTRRVSIPHRKFKNPAFSIGKAPKAEFPSLIGSSKTRNRWRKCRS